MFSSSWYLDVPALHAPQLSYANGEKSLHLEPLKGQSDPEKSDYTVGKVKVEIRLIKRAQGRWGTLIGDSPDRKSSHHAH